MKRTIRLTFSDGTENWSYPLDAAIGYMAVWGRETDTITDVHIRVFDVAYNGETPIPEIGASYHKADGQQMFYMAGIWDEAEKRFRFHS